VSPAVADDFPRRVLLHPPVASSDGGVLTDYEGPQTSSRLTKCSWDEIPTYCDDNTLSVFYINSRDLKSSDKFSYVEHLGSLNIAVICVSETWFSRENAMTFNLKDYNHYYNCRASRSGGGVSIFLRNDLLLLNVSSRCSSAEDVQILRIHFTIHTVPIYVLLIYYSHRSVSPQLIDLLDNFLPRSDSPCILVGDMNVDILKSDLISTSYLSFLASNGFCSLITSVTRPSSNTCLDHLCVSGFDSYLISSYGVVESNCISDHYPIFANFSLPSSSSDGTGVYFRRIFSAENYLLFKSICSTFDWTFLLCQQDIDSMMSMFYDYLYSIYDQCFPLKKIHRTRSVKRSPWFTNALRKLRSNLDRVSRIYFKSRCPVHKSRYYLLLKRYRLARKSCLSRYRSSHIARLGSSPKLLWRYVNFECGRKKNVPLLLGKLLLMT